MKMKRLFWVLLTLTMVLGMNLTAYADDDPPYALYKNTTTVIKFDNKEWYLIDYDDSTVTLLVKECVGASKYNSRASFVEYSQSTVKSVVDNWYNSNIKADAQKAVNGEMFLLTTARAAALSASVRQCSQVTGAGVKNWWLCSQGSSQGSNVSNAAYVDGEFGDVHDNGSFVLTPLGVRPALKLNLSSVIFSPESKTFRAVQLTAPIRS